MADLKGKKIFEQYQNLLTLGGKRIENGDGQHMGPELLDSINVEWFGAIEGGVEDNTAAIQAAIDAAEPRSQSVILRGKHRITSTLQFKNASLYGFNAEIILDTTQDLTVINAEGELSQVETLLAVDALRGNSIIELNSTENVSDDDLILLSSNEDFYIGSGSKKRELVQIVEVLSAENKVILEKPINDDYLITQSSKVRVITPSRFNCEGSVTLINKSPKGLGRGLQVRFGLNNRIECNIYGANYWGFICNTSYGVHSVTNVYDASKTGNGYGIYASGCCQCQFKGYIPYSRHAASALDSSWENIFEIVCSGSQPNSVLSAHPNCGSVYFNNCVVYGGVTQSPEGASTVPRPLTSGAEYTYVNNLTVIGGNAILGFRSTAPERVIKLFHADGVKVVQGYGTILSTTDVNVERIVVKNVSIVDSTMGTLFNFDGSHNQQIKSIEIEDIKSDKNSTFNRIASSAGGTGILPDILTLKNFSIYSKIVDTSFGGAFYFDVPSKTKKLVLEDVYAEGFSEWGRLNGIEELELKNVTLVGNADSFRLSKAGGTLEDPVLGMKKIQIDNCDFSKLTGLGNGLFRIDNDHLLFEKLIIRNSQLSLAFILGRPSTKHVPFIMNIGNVMNSPLSTFVNISSKIEDRIVYTGGASEMDFTAYGFADPNGKFFGNIGSLFSDKTNNKIYFKTSSNSSNTGWVELQQVI